MNSKSLYLNPTKYIREILTPKLKFMILFSSFLASHAFSQSFDSRIHQINKLRNFIRSENFERIKKRIGDVRSIDVIYKKSLTLCNYNIETALLICGFATLNHRKIELKIPTLKIKLPLILTSESEKDFEARVKNLPSKIFSDTLDDKDKLQHFFFSAYIAYKNRGRKIADKLGLLVEEGEKIGLNLSKDERDIIANRLGQLFGISLHKNPMILPSRFLRKDSIEKDFYLSLKSKSKL